MLPCATKVRKKKHCMLAAAATMHRYNCLLRLWLLRRNSDSDAPAEIMIASACILCESCRAAVAPPTPPAASSSFWYYSLGVRQRTPRLDQFNGPSASPRITILRKTRGGGGSGQRRCSILLAPAPTLHRRRHKSH